MKSTLILLFILLSADTFSQDKMTSKNPFLLFDQTAFDSDTCCWRKLCTHKKYLDAGNLIVSYLNNSKPTNTHSLNWHAGQMFACAHSDELAKKYFKRTYSIFYKWFGDNDAKAWYYYAKGTIAFIEHDKKSLEKAIMIWGIKFPTDNNYKALVRLSENWGKSYDLALAF
jgi:hypothetical protein